MKKDILIIACVLMSFTLRSQDIFKVIEVKRAVVYGAKFQDDTLSKYYRIVAMNDSMINNATYPILILKNIDTIKAINELLKFEGDTRLCVLPISNYNPARSQIYMGKNVNYSLQVEALFLINQLILAKPFNYASYPILVDKTSNKEYSVSGIAITRAFLAYKRWYQQLKVRGISWIQTRSIMPLNGSLVRWF